MNARKKNNSEISTDLVVPITLTTAFSFFNILLFSELKDLVHNLL